MLNHLAGEKKNEVIFYRLGQSAASWHPLIRASLADLGYLFGNTKQGRGKVSGLYSKILPWKSIIGNWFYASTFSSMVEKQSGRLAIAAEYQPQSRFPAFGVILRNSS